MVDIISKRSGPRREDVAAKRLIDSNRSTIEGLANQLSGGNYAAMRQPPKPPQPDGLILHDLAGGRAAQVTYQPYVRISLNGRVVIVDGETSKQLHFIGEVRNGPGGREFVLATADNKFYSPLDEGLCLKLADIDHKIIDTEWSEEDLAGEITERLNLGG